MPRFNERAETFLKRAALVVIILAALFLVVTSLYCRVDMNMENSSLENVVLMRDSIFLNLIVLAAAATLGAFFFRTDLSDKANPRILSLILFLWVVAFGTAFILTSRSAPTHDSYIVTVTGWKASTGDLSEFERVYYQRFPFQLGYVLWTELFCRLFSLGNNFLPLEIVNVFCLAIGEALLLDASFDLFEDRKVTALLFLFCLLFIQPVLFCSFLYGTVPGFLFAVLMIRCFQKFRQSGKLLWALPMALCGALAVLLKLNNMIPVAALIIVFVLILLREYKDPKQYVALVLLLAAVFGLKGSAVLLYEKRTDRDFGDGIPMICWAAMGMTSHSISEGWYDARYTVVNFEKTGLDPAATGELAKQGISERMEYFAEEPKEAFSFFTKKIVSQWHETTYQSVWTNQVRGQYGEKIGIAKWICGDGEKPVKDYMNRFSVLIFSGFLFSLFFLWKKETKPELLLLPIVFIGGFLYHTVFEGKSQYIVTYMIFLLPYAAYGWVNGCRYLADLVRSFKKEKENERMTSADDCK
ncbi:MAG: hypothetical protein MJ070_06875 [Lachnospiraceae bacterium]|nr:hypothetical protein [Lachnospiraceae bacterium]